MIPIYAQKHSPRNSIGAYIKVKSPNSTGMLLALGLRKGRFGPAVLLQLIL